MITIVSCDTASPLTPRQLNIRGRSILVSLFIRLTTSRGRKYLLVGRIALCSVDSSWCWTWPCWEWVGADCAIYHHANDTYLRSTRFESPWRALQSPRSNVIFSLLDAPDRQTTWAFSRFCALTFTLCLVWMQGKFAEESFLIPGQILRVYD